MPADLTGSNGLKMRYLRGDVVDELFGRLNASGSGWWTLTDHLGSVREVVTLGGVSPIHPGFLKRLTL